MGGLSSKNFLLFHKRLDKKIFGGYTLEENYNHKGEINIHHRLWDSVEHISPGN